MMDEVETLISRKNNENEDINKIIKEYCLKRNNFYPNDTSPNKFMLKLQYRVNMYYNCLNKSSNEYTKKFNK